MNKISVVENLVTNAIPLDRNFLDALPSQVERDDLNLVAPSNMAFVVFTSGSAGNPKGILLEHRSLCISAHAHGKVMRLDQSSRVLQFASHTFNVSNQDTWITLMRGGCVCVPSEEDRRNNLAGVINGLRVNWTFLTPTVADIITSEHVSTLKTLVLGGEALTRQNTRTWSSLRMLNSYGPAEILIGCAVSELSAVGDPSNFGHALDSAVLWIVDPQNHNRLVHIGAVGELLIEGPILARGCLNDPDKTKSSFI